MTEPTGQISDRVQQAMEAEQRRKRRSKLILKGLCVFTVLAVIALIMFCCRPDPREAKLETVAKTDSPKELARIAMENGSFEVARAAVAKLDDPALLERIAMNQQARAAADATLKLTQPDRLGRIALNSPHLGARRAAILQSTDQSVLETIALKRSWPMASTAALRLTDKQIARRVFDRTDNGQVKLSAARAIDDPELLKIVALSTNACWRSDEIAVKLLAHHQTELEQVAIQAAKPPIQIAAARLLTDPVARARVIVQGHSILYDLIRTLNDPTALAMVANAKQVDSWARREAVKRLTDQPTLAEIARSNFDPKVRVRATRQVTDPAVLRQLVKTKQGNQQRIAIGMITDVELLKTLLADGSGVEEVARKRLKQLALENDNVAWVEQFKRRHSGTDQELARIALATHYRTGAVNRITDPDVIKRVALANNRQNRIAAINRLDDQETLKRIAKNQKEPWSVRRAAMRRITDQDWLMELFIWRDPARTKGSSFASSDQKFEVLRYITDQNHLAAIAIDQRRDKGGSNLAWSAAQRVTDPELALKVLLESPYESARIWGARYATDPEALAQVGWKHLRNRNERQDIFREIAPKLEDRKLLLRMALNSSTSGGPNRAELRLAELDRTTPPPPSN